jgi:hypothetical protein
VKEVNVLARGKELVLSVACNEDLTLEKGTLERDDSLFEEVFHLKPVLHQKRMS